MVVRVHERVVRRHPSLTEQDVIRAWSNAFLFHERLSPRGLRRAFGALGVDGKGRTLEMVGSVLEDGSVLIYHAMTPPTKRMLQELMGADDELSDD